MKEQTGETPPTLVWFIHRRTGETIKTTKAKLRKKLYREFGEKNLTYRVAEWRRADEKESEILDKYPD